MRIKIRGGTANLGEPPLCTTCRFATIVKGPGCSDEIVECSQLAGSRRITFPVMACTDYSDRRRASLYQMEDLAWILRSDPKRKDIGFVKASSLTRRERFTLVEDDELD